MKIVTYNINGIRASANKGLVNWLKETNADIYALQEIRANNITAMEIFYGNFLDNINNYEAILNESKRAGYSGTALLVKEKPIKVVFGFGDNVDDEGRLITAYYKDFIVVNCYVPNGGTRLDYKMDYYQKLTNYLCELKKENNVIFCSDSNIAHCENDVSQPDSAQNKTGFLPIEQQAFSNLINQGFIDSYRALNPDQKAYTWISYGERNYGINSMKYRFDYIITNSEFNKHLKSSIICDVKYSDHLPVINEYSI